MRNVSAMRVQGFSLVEVMVSLVLVSIGLMGTAKLTSASLASTNNSYYRSQATFMTDDIMDRMRANLAAARSGQYVIATGGVLSASPGTVAAFDCTEWLASLAGALPEGVGTLNVDGSGVATITIGWTGAEPFVTTSRL